jgi:cytochrome bd-type quinol oxidase subunit 1
VAKWGDWKKHNKLGKGLFVLVFAFGATSGITISAFTT